MGGHHEDRFGQIELARDDLHACGIETLGIEHDGQRVPGEALRRENVERSKAPAHRVLPIAARFEVKLRRSLSAKCSAVRSGCRQLPFLRLGLGELFETRRRDLVNPAQAAQ